MEREVVGKLRNTNWNSTRDLARHNGDMDGIMSGLTNLGQTCIALPPGHPWDFSVDMGNGHFIDVDVKSGERPRDLQNAGKLSKKDYDKHGLPQYLYRMNTLYWFTATELCVYRKDLLEGDLEEGVPSASEDCSGDPYWFVPARVCMRWSDVFPIPSRSIFDWSDK